MSQRAAAGQSVSGRGFGKRWLTDGWGQIGLAWPQFKHSDVTLKGDVNVNSIWDKTFAGGAFIALYLT